MPMPTAPLPLVCLHSCCSWGAHVLHVQKMINNELSTALGGQLTRSEALFGAPDMRPFLPTAEELAQLLAFSK